ncbi:MAG: hypothetical protein ACRCZY_05895, partial [Phocaeicola sp.]
TFAHISTSMTNNETIGFIQIKHSFFEYKSRKEKREEKYGRIRMDTNIVYTFMACTSMHSSVSILLSEKKIKI